MFFAIARRSKHSSAFPSEMRKLPKLMNAFLTVSETELSHVVNLLFVLPWPKGDDKRTLGSFCAPGAAATRARKRS